MDNSENNNQTKTAEELLKLWADIRLSLELLDKDLHDCLLKGDFMASRRTKIKLTNFKLETSKLSTEIEKFEKQQKENRKTK